jgi:hypothetical protein
MVVQLPQMMQRANPYRWDESVMRPRNGHRWLGCQDPSTAVSNIDNGWPQLLKEVKSRTDAIRSQIELGEVEALNVEVRRRKKKRGDHGDTLDMNRVWSGHVDTAWERPVKTSRLTATQRYAIIYADLWVLAMVSAEETLWRAAAINFIVTELTRMGVHTEVWSGGAGHSTYHDGPNNLWFGVKVKDFTQPLNEERLAVLSHVAFFRTYGFGMMFGAPFTATSGLGYPSNRGMVKPLRDRESAGERVVRIGNVLNQRSAVVEITRVLNSFKGAQT